MRRGPLGRILWALYLVLVMGFLLAPVAFVVFYSFNDASMFRLPVRAYSLRWYREFFASDQFQPALRATLMIAAVVVPFTLLVALPTAHLMARGKGQAWLGAALTAPVVVPGVVTGIAFLGLFTMLGIGDALTRLVIALSIFCLPFSLRALNASYAGLDRRPEEAARDLGATPLRAYLHVTLPQLKAGLLAGAIFAFVEATDNFSIAVFLADTRTKTLPIAAYEHIRDFDDPTVAAMATVLTLVALVLVLVLEKVIGLEKLIRHG
ncbi:ABC transporter permease subunit [Rhodovarius crocodyli]|uniref:ABC transporter permease subunit n=1 Tax=Rhodovarius crocodyli TaxID=1979269 RepID=A0A437M1X4_9PROT|nr:ABC transporter permease subunit [Rhodovarius crocodyli]RVT91701.1 ABC transporter permease subunit [Rhodovarius crocodyli]